MSIDTHIYGINMSLYSSSLVNQCYYDLKAVEHMLGESTPLLIKVDRRHAEEVKELLDDLECPPAVNEIDVQDIIRVIKYFPNQSHRGGVQHQLWFWGRSHLVFQGQRSFPRFLRRRTERGYTLWLKFIGRWDKYFDRTDEEWVTLTIGDTDYRVRPRRSLGGFLQGDDLKVFANELKPYLGELQSLYDGFDEDISNSPAVWGHGIEWIYILCHHLDASLGEGLIGFTQT